MSKKEFKKIVSATLVFVMIVGTFSFASSMGGQSADNNGETEVWERDDYYDEFGRVRPQYEEWDWRDVYEETEETPAPIIPSIDYDKPNVKRAKYEYDYDSCTIQCDGITYYVSGKDEAGFYSTVTIGEHTYDIGKYGKIAGITDYYYKGEEYEVDEDGFIIGYKQNWKLHNDDSKVGIGEYVNTKLLFKKEVPFNILWKNRPLTEEEEELLYTGPGVHIKTFSTGLSDSGDANVVINRKPEIADSEDSGVGFKKQKPVDDPMDPMKAKSVKKKKDKD